MTADIRTESKLMRVLLVARRTALQAEVGAARLAQHAQPGTAGAGEVGDLKDAADDAMRAEVGEAEEQRDLDELASIDRALLRLDASGYGDCIACGEPIAPARLRVRPDAERCTACQAAAERVH